MYAWDRVLIDECLNVWVCLRLNQLVYLNLYATKNIPHPWLRINLVSEHSCELGKGSTYCSSEERGFIVSGFSKGRQRWAILTNGGKFNHHWFHDIQGVISPILFICHSIVYIIFLFWTQTHTKFLDLLVLAFSIFAYIFINVIVVHCWLN